MAEYTALAPLFTDIANAIRSKTGETGAITANTFPQVISNSLLGSVWSYSYLKNLDSSAGGNYNGYEMY